MEKMAERYGIFTICVVWGSKNVYISMWNTNDIVDFMQQCASIME